MGQYNRNWRCVKLSCVLNQVHHMGVYLIDCQQRYVDTPTAFGPNKPVLAGSFPGSPFQPDLIYCKHD